VPQLSSLALAQRGWAGDRAARAICEAAARLPGAEKMLSPRR